MKKQKIDEILKELAIKDKALELACGYVLDEWQGTAFGDNVEKIGGFVKYFIEQAKEELK